MYTAADWQRLWNTAAKEGVILADSLAQRRKERRRLQKEYEHARDGLPASVRRDGTPGTRKEVKSDPEKAQRILEQLERWVADPEVDDVELSKPWRERAHTLAEEPPEQLWAWVCSI